MGLKFVHIPTEAHPHPHRSPPKKYPITAGTDVGPQLTSVSLIIPENGSQYILHCRGNRIQKALLRFFFATGGIATASLH